MDEKQGISVPPRWPLRHGDLLLAGGVALLFVIHFFFTDDYFLGSGTDIISLQYPVHRFATHWMRQGVLPLWNPHIFGGVPFQAGVHGYLYPGLWTGLLLPVGLDIKVGIALHLILAAAGGAFLARGSVKQMIPRAVVGAVYALSGFMMLHLYAGHRTMVMTAAYLPWIAAALRRVLDGERGALLWGGMTFGLMMLSGHYQIIFIGILGLSLWLFFDTLCSRRKPLSPFRERWPGLVGVLSILSLGIGVAAVQLIPALSNAELSQRSGDSVAFAASFSSAPLNLISYLFPHFFGNRVDAPFVGDWSYWESLGYVGIIPLCMVSAAHAVLPWRRMLPRTVVMLIAIILSLGAHTPIFDIYAAWIPGADLFRSPGRFCLLVTLFSALITGEMLDVFYGRGKETLERLPGIRYWTGFVPLASALGIVVWFRSWSERDLAAFFSSMRSPHAALPEDVVSSLLELVGQDLACAALGTIACAAALLLTRKRPKSGALIGGILSVMAILNLYQFGHRFLIMGEKSQFELPEAIHSFLQEEAEKGTRVILPAASRFVNSPMIYGGGTPGGYDIFIHKRFAEYLNAAAGRPPERFLSYARVRNGSALIRHMGVRYVISVTPLRGGRNRFFYGYEGYEPIRRIGQFTIHENKDFVPRAFVVHDVEVIHDTKERLSRLNAKTFDVMKTVVLEHEPTFDVAPSLGTEAVSIKSITPNHVVMNVTAKSDGVLVMSDSLQSGWEAFVDSKAVPMAPANHVMRGVPISKGHHLVEMRYLPTGVVVGAVFSALSVLVLVLGGVIYRRRRGG